MTTLYDLLGALPDDDADGLRAAFRKAAKANHPDLHPGNPEAAERFRRIVRANTILSDPQQRVAYDHLLEIARRQQRELKRSILSDTLRRLPADAFASAIVSALLVGGYLLLQSTDGVPHASARVTEITMRDSVQAGPVRPTEISDAGGEAEQRDEPEAAAAGIKVAVNMQAVGDLTQPHATVPALDTPTDLESAQAPQADTGRRNAKFYRERGMQAYRSGDLYRALVNFDLAIDLEPDLPDSYLDRGIVFHRLGDLKRAFADVAEAKRIDQLSRSKSPSVAKAP